MPNIIVIDDSKMKRNFLAQVLGKDFTVNCFASGREALEQIADIDPMCVLLDMERPDEDPIETLHAIKDDPRFCNVPIVFVTSLNDPKYETLALESGAMDFVSNQFSPEIIRSRVRHLVEIYAYRRNLENMLQEKNQDVYELQEAFLVALSDLVEWGDNKTNGHAQRTRSYVECLLNHLMERGLYCEELTRQLANDIIRAAPLHDLGNMGIKDNILDKPGKLTDEEFEKIKKHTILGGKTISKAMMAVQKNDFLTVVQDMILCHHERWDGSGYPRGLKGAEIPLSSRIVAIADVYDALVCDRPYKEAISHEQAVETIRNEIGSHFDPTIGEAFLACEQMFRQISQTA